MDLLELKRDRRRLVDQAGAILKKAHDEGRSMTEQETTEWNDLHRKADGIKGEIEVQERQEAAERSLAESAINARPSNGPSADQAENEELEKRAFRSWLAFGPEGMTDEERSIARFVSKSKVLQGADLNEERAQTVTTTGGGYLVPRGFQAELDKAMLAYGGVREAARVIQTASGNTLDWPTVNDTGNTGRLLGINTQATTTDVAYGSVTFEAYKFSSDAVLVPVELLQDAAFDLDTHLRDLLSERLGRITNQYFTTGTGSSQPKGVVAAATDSAINIDISSGLTYANMVDVEHSVDPAYRRSPGARWMFHDDFLALVKKLVDLNGRPIFRAASEAAGQVDTILGYPFTVNQDVADPGTATNKALLFGDFSKYIVRVVRPMALLRLVERYADYHQIGFLAFERADGDLIDAGTNPIKYADMVA